MQTYLITHVLECDSEDIIVECIEVPSLEIAKEVAIRSSMALYPDYSRIVTTLQRIA